MQDMQAVRTVGVAGDFGKYLIGRGIGERIRTSYFAGSPPTWPLKLDFSEVVQATESCVDELFGALVRKHGIDAVRRVEIVGASKPVADAITFVFQVAERHPRTRTPDELRALMERVRKSRV